MNSWSGRSERGAGGEAVLRSQKDPTACGHRPSGSEPPDPPTRRSRRRSPDRVAGRGSRIRAQTTWQPGPWWRVPLSLQRRSPVAQRISLDWPSWVLIDPDVLFGGRERVRLASRRPLRGISGPAREPAGRFQLRVGGATVTPISPPCAAHTVSAGPAQTPGRGAAALFHRFAADFAVKSGPIREPSETAPDVVRASDPKLDLDRASGAL